MTVQPEAPGQPADGTETMPTYMFYLALGYLVLLGAFFICYETSPTLRSSLPSHFGELPAGIIWFGAIGAVLKSLYGIFSYNKKKWTSSFQYWHYCRPLVGAVTGSMGAVIYLVLLKLGNTSTVKVDTITFYVAAFAFGFADSAFLSVLKNVTNVLIKPGKGTQN